jgi:hypothetical protein
MAAMTQARKAAHGLGNPPPLDRWIDAVLLLCAALVQGVVTTLGMWRRVGQRDWHTQSGSLALPRVKGDIHIKESIPPTESFSGLSRESLLDHRGDSQIDPLEPHNQDSRDKPENGTIDVARPVSPQPLIPAKAGIQGGWRTLSCLAASIPRASQHRFWIPAFAGMSTRYAFRA